MKLMGSVYSWSETGYVAEHHIEEAISKFSVWNKIKTSKSLKSSNQFRALRNAILHGMRSGNRNWVIALHVMTSAMTSPWWHHRWVTTDFMGFDNFDNKVILFLPHLCIVLSTAALPISLFVTQLGSIFFHFGHLPFLLGILPLSHFLSQGEHEEGWNQWVQLFHVPHSPPLPLLPFGAFSPFSLLQVPSSASTRYKLYWDLLMWLKVCSFGEKLNEFVGRERRENVILVWVYLKNFCSILMDRYFYDHFCDEM